MKDDEVLEDMQVIQEVVELERLKKRKKEIEDEIADIEKYLDKTVEKFVEFNDEETGEYVHATVVRGTTDKFDEHLMSTRYKRLYTLVTKRVVDKSLYLDAVRSGAISPELHARFHHEVPKKPYVKITRIKRSVVDG